MFTPKQQLTFLWLLLISLLFLEVDTTELGDLIFVLRSCIH